MFDKAIEYMQPNGGEVAAGLITAAALLVITVVLLSYFDRMEKRQRRPTAKGPQRQPTQKEHRAKRS